MFIGRGEGNDTPSVGVDVKKKNPINDRNRVNDGESIRSSEAFNSNDNQNFPACPDENNICADAESLPVPVHLRAEY